MLSTRQLAAAALLGLASAVAGAQTTAQSGTDGAGAKGMQKDGSKTPAAMPPGAASTKGNKAASPVSGAMPTSADTPTNPETGSTPGMPPGAKSAKGDKAMTPRPSPKASGAM